MPNNTPETIKDTEKVIELASKTTMNYSTCSSNLPKQIEEAAEIVRKIPSEPFSVKPFIRILPEGWQASEKAIQNALEAGIELEEGQTFVVGFMKNLPPVA